MRCRHGCTRLTRLFTPLQPLGLKVEPYNLPRIPSFARFLQHPLCRTANALRGYSAVCTTSKSHSETLLETESDIMKKTSPRLAHARNELKLLQQILGLIPKDKPEQKLKDATFVCIDCEAFEDDQTKVTEIGVAVLDTRDIRGVQPQQNAEKWIAKIKCAHYRPIQYSTLLNRRFVKGCEDRFNFGVTMWINLDDAETVLRRIFLDPARTHEAANFDVDIADQKRNVLFAGHGVSADKGYLAQLGFSLRDGANVVRTFDTQKIAGATRKSQVGLQRLLISLGQEPVNLHNAGNDAAYTLHALILMAIKDHEAPNSVFSTLEKYVGKLPDGVNTEGLTKHVFAGTTRDETIEPGVENETKNQKHQAMGIIDQALRSKRRRQRSRASRGVIMGDGGNVAVK